MHGIEMKKINIIGKSGLIEIERESAKLRGADRIVLNHILSLAIQLKKSTVEIENKMARLVS
jgi:hypothetical protein